MRSGINNTRVLNTRLILQKLLQCTLSEDKQISQGDLQKHIAVNTSTIQRICDELLEKKLISATSLHNKLKGRNPKSYSLAAQFGEFLVVTLGVDYFSIFTFDFSMNLLQKEHFGGLENSHKPNSFDGILQKLHQELATRITAKTLNCTIVLPGTTDNSNTTLLQSYPLHVENIPFAERFADLSVPIYVENNVNSLAIGFSQQKQFGKNFIVIAMGAGLGIGIISNNTIFKGQNGHAGDLGHLFYQETEERCYCGNSGCIELFLKSSSFHKMTKQNYFTAFARLLRNIQLSYDPVQLYLTGTSVDHITKHAELYHMALAKEHIGYAPICIETRELDFARGGGVLGFQKFLEEL